MPGKSQTKYVKGANKKIKTRIKKRSKIKTKSNSSTKQGNTNSGKVDTNSMDPSDWMTDDELQDYLDNVYGIDWL